MRRLIAIALLTATPGTAFGYCSEPSFTDDAPEPPSSYERPSVPYCLNDYKWSGRHTCESWEIDSYQSDIEDYVRKLNDYIQEASAFADAAIEHVESAAAYARCEAEEAGTQHR